MNAEKVRVVLKASDLQVLKVKSYRIHAGVSKYDGEGNKTEPFWQMLLEGVPNSARSTVTKADLWFYRLEPGTDWTPRYDAGKTKVTGAGGAVHPTAGGWQDFAVLLLLQQRTPALRMLLLLL
jgi:hypothetical protein